MGCWLLKMRSSSIASCKTDESSCGFTGFPKFLVDSVGELFGVGSSQSFWSKSELDCASEFVFGQSEDTSFDELVGVMVVSVSVDWEDVLTLSRSVVYSIISSSSSSNISKNRS